MGGSAAVFIATESGTIELDGEQIVVNAGTTRVREGHKLLKALPDWFKPVEDGIEFDTDERATARPGEKRKATRKATTKAQADDAADADAKE